MILTVALHLSNEQDALGPIHSYPADPTSATLEGNMASSNMHQDLFASSYGWDQGTFSLATDLDDSFIETFAGSSPYDTSSPKLDFRAIPTLDKDPLCKDPLCDSHHQAAHTSYTSLDSPPSLPSHQPMEFSQLTGDISTPADARHLWKTSFPGVPQDVSASADGHLSRPSPQHGDRRFLHPSVDYQLPASTTPSRQSSASPGSGSTSSALSPSPSASAQPRSESKGKGRARHHLSDADLERQREKDRRYQETRRRKIGNTVGALEDKLAERDRTIALLREENSNLKGMVAGLTMNGANR